MAEEVAALAGGLGLADAIAVLRDELLRARAAGAGSDIQLPVDSMTVELTVTATRSLDGKAGFTVPLVGVELGGGGSRGHESGHTVTVVFGGPVDREGNPVKVATEAAALPG
jgi:hypothetical protein